MLICSHSPSDTELIGEKLGQSVRPGAVIALFGPVGAGKTVFVRGLARGLGVKARVTSPTFTIVNEYIGRLPLFHFDMYRLSSPDELFDIGWEDYLAQNGVCAVEWSENVEAALPDGYIRVDINTDEKDESLRKINIEGEGQ